MFTWPFCCFCCYWKPFLLHGYPIGGMGLVRSYICWGLSCDQLHGWFWRRYHEVLRKRYILLHWDEMLCIYIYVKSICSKDSISFPVSLFSFCFPDWSIENSGVLRSPRIIVLGAMCALSLVKILLPMRVPLHLEHRCLELWVFLGEFFPWPARSELLCLFWWP